MVRGVVPVVFRWRAPAWQADVDAFGELRTSTLLRLLQETATRASTDAGFDPAYYRDSGAMWLVRRTAVALLAPVRYGDEIEIRTWIADFRRVRSQREYELSVGERPVARAHTDWVYVDAAGRPARIPADMERRFVPEGGATLDRPPFPAPPPAAPAITTTRRIELHELDAIRHVNNANYVHYLEQVALDACAAVRWPLAAQLEAGGRFRATAHDIEYLEPALYDDAVIVRSWLVGLDATEVERHTEIGRAAGPRPLVRARSRFAWVGRDDGRPLAIPDGLHAALATSTVPAA